MANSSNASKTPRRRPTGPVDDEPSPEELLKQARDRLAELIGVPAETVSSFEQTENGWMLEIEVLEIERVPDTMSLLASYVVRLDPQGELLGTGAPAATNAGVPTYPGPAADRPRSRAGSVDKACEMGIDWWEDDPSLSSRARHDELARENAVLRERPAALEPGRGQEKIS